ncbi:DUF488 domain-containing protein [Legionella micdadei]|uniref:Uncharacterized conserved protein YeaO, DUF488 family n=1 Tax=Legionella micdadei TaxID=451 RepID=A0A098GJA7_LEGMI|nr:DUF488 family protein [Legionella micdadei]ARG96543.1 hypothetical protein B6N58_01990 [Legionella micdadei]ARG99291.1 hypothetical protein B6V88_01980 [Legionella micdadei]KTD27387.1 uroporphyrin-III C- methyltransferase [Legionella micdadei]NSL18824.1 DUF488 family protein [Legionella micdadei]CEG62097.1 conserved protein of unknown function [Legionella micdadei]
MNKINIYRVYEAPSSSKNGLWILVDRLWPRGLKKEAIPFDLWLKDIAPSAALRTWFNHQPEKWIEFANRYIDELKNKPELITSILEKAKNSEITLFYAAKDEQHNNAKVLKAVLESWPKWPAFKE